MPLDFDRFGWDPRGSTQPEQTDAGNERLYGRPEGIEAGVVKLVGTNPETIISEVSRLLLDNDAYQDESSYQSIR